MSRSQKTPVEFNQFIGGLFTEASPLNFPPNASVDEDNFVLLRTGSRQRRLGVDLETDYLRIDLTDADYAAITNYGINSYIWKKAGRRRDTDLAVVQIGSKLFFFDTEEETAVSAGLIELDTGSGTSYYYEVSDYSGGRLSLSAINGFLVVVGHSDDILMVEYREGTEEDGSLDYLVTSTARLKTRDLWGVFDNRAPDVRLEA